MLRKPKAKEPFIPVERHETLRQEMISFLRDRAVSSKEISTAVGIPEKEVYDHLEHIQRTLNSKEDVLSVSPAECVKCGFVFKKRERLKKPGRCPVCKGEQIHDPLFKIEKR